MRAFSRQELQITKEYIYQVKINLFNMLIFITVQIIFHSIIKSLNLGQYNLSYTHYTVLH